jgi:hypothetical protein
MVVIQENKTCFVSSSLHLLHGMVLKVELTATICHINYVNIMGLSGNGRIQRTPCPKKIVPFFIFFLRNLR